MSMTLRRVCDLRPGDLVDHEGDPFADPECDHAGFDCELLEVVCVEREPAGCTAVSFEGWEMSHRSISDGNSRCGQSAISSVTMTRTRASALWRTISASSRYRPRRSQREHATCNIDGRAAISPSLRMSV